MPTIHLQARMNLAFASGSDLLDVDFTLKTGSLTGLYGPSGSGKTTLLRILAGLTTPESGRIRVDDRFWLDTERRIDLPAQQRNVGMVFQDAALFPNMTVRQNVEFAAENRRAFLVDELLELMGLQNLADRKPATLSGGQRQRVALIRALARRPKVLLLDEPFSALDRETRDQLLMELVRLHQRFETTTVLVSHQLEEIHRVADHWIELKMGKIHFAGDHPDRSSFKSQRVAGIVTELKEETGQVQISLTDQTVLLEMSSQTSGWKIGERVTFLIDPNNLDRPAN
ncbi:sulfate/molybdate ABC transporter ATP-binding protein [Larkinella terrae]|uniref:ATP-binding cassette domain-containing protein n=1 Tax=Larkinella terrae TaxID=2025311 RepID=A0A7K0EVA1_9BACT|nr:ATP-binding cassette domain-containing protein [Larkinella terrae]MRS65743.1 ATP-binding cassette domain-containing protein [Larkinella terrae]